MGSPSMSPSEGMRRALQRKGVMRHGPKVNSVTKTVSQAPTRIKGVLSGRGPRRAVSEAGQLRKSVERSEATESVPTAVVMAKPIGISAGAVYAQQRQASTPKDSSGSAVLWKANRQDRERNTVKESYTRASSQKKQAQDYQALQEHEARMQNACN